MKEKSNIEEGFLFDAEEIGKQETDAQTSEGTESTDTPRHRGRKRSMVTEDRPPLTPEQMRELLEGITEIETATGIRYIRIHLTAKMLIGIRESPARSSPSISANCIWLIRNASALQVRKSSESSLWVTLQPSPCCEC